MNLAKRAVDASDGKPSAFLDTYARALFANGQTEEAILQEKKAIQIAENEETKTELKQTLETYEAKSKETAKPEVK